MCRSLLSTFLDIPSGPGGKGCHECTPVPKQQKRRADIHTLWDAQRCNVNVLLAPQARSAREIHLHSGWHSTDLGKTANSNRHRLVTRRRLRPTISTKRAVHQSLRHQLWQTRRISHCTLTDAIRLTVDFRNNRVQVMLCSCGMFIMDVCVSHGSPPLQCHNW